MQKLTSPIKALPPKLFVGFIPNAASKDKVTLENFHALPT